MIHSAPDSCVKIVVILPNEERRLITCTFSESCSVVEILEGVGIDLSPNSTVHCEAIADDEVDYLVMIKNGQESVDNTDVIISPKMAPKKDSARFIEETIKYTKSIEEISSNWRTNLDDEMVASLLDLVRGIDRLLTPVGGSRVTEKAISLPKEPSLKEKKPKTIEFDIGVHLPMNFKTPVPPLNEKNCPGLRELRKDYKPVIVNPKKKK